MKRSIPTVLVLFGLAAGSAAPHAAVAQQAAPRFDPGPAWAAARAVDAVAASSERPAQDASSGLRPLRVAKWSTLGASLIAAGYGFAVHTDANETYRQLEEVCDQEPDRCRQRAADGAYADEELEAMYQDVVELDDRARLALVGSQVALASSVLLFILDLREFSTPPNVPYDPPGFRLVPRRGGAAELRMTVPFGGR